MIRSIFLFGLCAIGVVTGALMVTSNASAASCFDLIEILPDPSGMHSQCVPTKEACSKAGGFPAVEQGDDCKATNTYCCAFPKGVTPLPVTPQATSFELTNPIGAGSTLFTVIRNVITFFVGMVGALALGVFVYAGVTWMTAGSSDRIQKAKDAMKYAIIGLALIAFAFAITTFFIDTLTGKVQLQSLKDQAAQQKAAATPPPVNP